MSQKRIDGFLSREITLALLSGEESKSFLSVLKPICMESENGLLDCDGNLAVYMKGYELSPFSSEQPFILYFDCPLQLKQISHHRYCLMTIGK